MSQLHFYVPDEVENKLRLKAKQANLPLSKYLAEVVKREAGIQGQWSEEYLALFDEGPDESLQRPEQPPLDHRQSFE